MDTLRQKAAALPDNPGIYKMLDSSGVIIYIGKAKNLKNRVSQYFQENAGHTLKTRLMVSNVADFQVIIVSTELDALLLENSLIKQHLPKYNILLKDDKAYPYIRLDLRQRYPTFSLAQSNTGDGAEFFGPFGGRGLSNQIIDSLKTAFKLPQCGKVFPRDIGKSRPCLNYQMKLCAGYCLPDTHQEDYREAIEMAAEILRGKYRQLTNSVFSEMQNAAEDMAFERAARLRDRYKTLKGLENRQTVTGALPELDAAACALGDNRAVLCILHYCQGGLSGKDLVFGENPLGESESVVFGELLSQYYLGCGRAPKTVCLASKPADLDQLTEAIASAAGNSVNVYQPMRGEKLVFARLAKENALEELLRATVKNEKTLRPLFLLENALALSSLPVRIEGYDISNTAGMDTTGAMVVFKDGRSARSLYRHFVLNSDPGGDDYGAMREVLSRRLQRLKEEASGFEIRPNLILIDGGVAHAAAALDVLNAFDENIPIFGMVKDDRHRTRALVSPDGREIGIKNEPALFALIGTIQEEAHRFAIGLHRKKRGKSVTASALDAISGIGDKRKGMLLARFKSIEAIANADMTQLKAALPLNAAKAVYEHFHTGENK